MINHKTLKFDRVFTRCKLVVLNESAWCRVSQFFKIFENQSSTCWCQNPINQGKLQKNPLRKPLEVTQDWITCDCLQFSLPSWWKDVLGCLLSKDDLHRNSLVLGVFSIDWRSLMIDTKASIDNLHSFLSY